MDFPDLPEKFQLLAEELKINPEDITEHHTQGGGPGGQKVNKSTNCVELHHIPTGINVRVHKHRSLSANRLSAYKLLILKIEEEVKGKESERAKKAHKIRKQKERRSRRSKEKMLEEKRRKGEVKETRRKIV